MNATRDDDALNWAGDDDPTLSSGGSGRAKLEPTELPEGWTIPQVSADVPRETAPSPAKTEADPAEPESAALGSVALVGIGILSGMYLLYTIGWFIGVARIEQPISGPVAEFMFSLGAWLAVAAPLVWFGVTFWLTTSRPRARLIWLLIGVIVLAPWPFVIGSGAGS
ncbi:DNA polymerase III subunit gamma/tau [Cryobacterium aureum]|uniref:DNA polymerase III subunit gamma/tau n=1 Tax=Cryobacterium aureum TaxID=995037 RepID=UPI000CF394DD|nr:DNA polymerase III subunit gamma/tau [Cryobacterium aureum]